MHRFIEWEMQFGDGCYEHKRMAFCAIGSLALIGRLYFWVFASVVRYLVCVL